MIIKKGPSGSFFCFFLSTRYWSGNRSRSWSRSRSRRWSWPGCRSGNWNWTGNGSKFFYSQTVATIIRGIAVGEIRLADLGRTLSREAVIGLILGLVLGIAGFARALLLDTDVRVALVLSLTLPLVVVWANAVATLVPLIAERVNIDPAVVSTPMITTIVDASGMLIYLSLAAFVLQA